MKKNGWIMVVNLDGCSLGLDKNHVCDVLLCKFRCPKSNEPETQEKIAKMICPRNIECKPHKSIKSRVRG